MSPWVLIIGGGIGMAVSLALIAVQAVCLMLRAWGRMGTK